MRRLLGAMLIGAIAWGVGCEGEIGVVTVSEPDYVDVGMVHCKDCKAELPYIDICTECQLCRVCDECFMTCITCRGEVKGARICPRDGRCPRCDRCSW